MKKILATIPEMGKNVKSMQSTGLNILDKIRNYLCKTSSGTFL